MRYTTLAEFYPFYLAEHSNKICRRLHVIGTVCMFMLLAAAAVFANAGLLLGLPIVGYGFAWVGHFVFEKNKPATFQQPIFSFICDFLMFRDVILRRIAW